MKKVISKLLITLLVSMLCVTNISINVLAEDEPINENPSEEVLPVAEPLEEDEPLDNFIDDLQGENQDEEGIEPQEVNDQFDITSYFTVDDGADLISSASVQTINVSLENTDDTKKVKFRFNYPIDIQEEHYTVIKKIENTSEECDQISVEFNKISGLLANPVSNSGHNDYLDDYFFTFEKVNDKYLIKAPKINDKTKYVALSYRHDPVTTVEQYNEANKNYLLKEIRSTNKADGSVNIIGNNGGTYLYFWKDGKNYFDRTNAASSTNTDMYLIRKAEENGETKYVIETEQPQDGGKYLICSKYNNEYYFVRPEVTGVRQSMVGKFNKTKIGDNYEAEATIKYATDSVNEVPEIIIYGLTDNNEKDPSKALYVVGLNIRQQVIRRSNLKESINQTKYIPQGSINRVYVDGIVPDEFNDSHIEIFNKIVNDGYESYAAEYCYRSDAGGAYGAYDNSLKPLSEATFNASIIAKYNVEGTRIDDIEEDDVDLQSSATLLNKNAVNKLKLYASSGDGVYLHPSSHYLEPNSYSQTTPIKSSIEIETTNTFGEFTIKGESDYLAFRKKVDWGVFYSKNTTSAQNNDQSENDCNFVIYKKDNLRGPTDTSIPGYKRIMNLSEINDGDELLFTSVCEYSGNNYIYIVNPSGVISETISTNGTFRNSDVLVYKDIYTTGNTILDIKGISNGESDIVTNNGGCNTKIVVVDAPNSSNIDKTIQMSNKSIENAICGPYMLAEVIPSGATKSSTIVKQWLTTDENIATIRNSYNDYGIIKTKLNNEDESVAYVGYIDNDDRLHYIKLTVVNINNAKLKENPIYVTGNTLELKNSVLAISMMNTKDKIYNSSDFIKLYTDTYFYIPYVGGSINFYSGSVSDEYVISFNEFKNSQGDYFSIVADNFEDTEVFKKISISGNFANKEYYSYGSSLENQVMAAKELGYQVVAGFSSLQQYDDVRIASESLPVINKTVEYIYGVPRDNHSGEKTKIEYRDGMPIEAGDKIYFNVEVKRSSLTTDMSSKEGYFEFKSSVITDELPDVVANKMTISYKDENGTDQSATYTLNTGNNSIDNLTVTNTRNQDNTVSLEIKDILNNYQKEKDISIVIEFEYAVKDSTSGSGISDIENISRGKPIINTATMKNNIVSKYNQKSISLDSSARAVLTISPQEIFKYMNLSLENDVKLNVYVDLSPYSQSVDEWKQNGFKMGVQFEDNSITYAEFPNTYYTGNGVDSNEHLYKFTVNVAPKYIGDTIELFVATGTYDRITVPVEASIKTYADRLINNKDITNDSSKQYLTELVNDLNKKYGQQEAIKHAQQLQLVLASMLDYATAAQNYTNYHTDKPANSIVTNDSILYSANDSAKIRDYLDNVITNEIGNTLTLEDDCDVVDIIGMNMVVNSVNELRVYFKTIGISINDLEVINRELVSDRRTDTIYSITSDMTENIGQNEYGYYVAYPDMTIQNLSANKKLTLIYTNKAGIKSEASLEFTALDYIRRIKDNQTKEMMNKMYCFGKMIREYYGVEGALTNNRGVN